MRGDRRRAAMQARQIVAILPYLPRVGRWSALSGALLLSSVLLLWASTRESWGATAALGNLRLAAVMLCGAAVFTLDDPAADITAASPTALRRRRAASLGLALATMAVAWEALLGGGSLLLDEAADACLALVRWPLTVELLWLLAVGVAVATATARRLGGVAGGIAAGPTVVLVYAGVHQLPANWTLIAGGPLDPVWAPAHRRLVVLTVAAVAVAVWAVRDPWQSRRPDPARPRRVRSASVVLAVVAVVAASFRPESSVTTSERLDATLDDLVASQGIEQLTVVIASGDMRWARTVGAHGSRLPVGVLSVAEVGDTVTHIHAAAEGTTTIRSLETWMRELAGREGGLDDRLAESSPPAGTAWTDRDGEQPSSGPRSELRYVRASGTVVATMTGARTAPCGIAVADALTTTLAKRR